MSILDERITKTTQDGVYPVLIFRADATGVYLSLMQGTTNPIKEFGNEQAEIQALKLKNRILSNTYEIKTWDTRKLDLRTTTSLGKSYEKSNIAAKYYALGSLPTDEVFRNDLTTILKVYDAIASEWSTYKDSSTIAIESGNNPMPKKTIQILSHSTSLVDLFEAGIESANLKISHSLPIRFVAALLAKPFVILTGLAGSGKTKLAEAFALWISESDEQICFVSVGADWTNREPLLGFPNALEQTKYVKPECGALDLLLNACAHPDKPYFLILDEMNMSHVERYFADFLSAMESTDRKIALHSGKDAWDGVPSSVQIPRNLFIIGTVNIDETTYMFSPKVLDRAHVIEFRISTEEMHSFLANAAIIDMESLRAQGKTACDDFIKKSQEKRDPAMVLLETFMPFFDNLQKIGAEFGYRTASEIARFVSICQELAGGAMDIDEIVDAAVMQKLLPKVHGSRNRIEKVLRELGRLCLKSSITSEVFTDTVNPEYIRYPLSYEKCRRMHGRVISDGFTSYAEA